MAGCGLSTLYLMQKEGRLMADCEFIFNDGIV